MANSKVRLLSNGLTFLCLITVLVSCSNLDPKSDQTQYQVTSHEPFDTINSKFLEVNELVSGFGGMFYDEKGFLNVRLKGSPSNIVAVKASLVAAIRTVFGDEALLENFTSIPGVLSAGLDIASRTKVVTGSKYEWSQLYRWNIPLTEVLTMPGVEFTDIDEKTNTLAVGFSDPNNLPQIKKRIVELGIPLEVVDFVEDEGAVAGATLQNKIAPYGGAMITWSQGRYCTLGLTVRRNGVLGFITNSHCSDRQFAKDSTAYHQPTTNGTTNQIGIEAFDPNYFTRSTSPACPLGHACRYSDASFVDYRDSVQPFFRRFYVTSINTPPPHDLTIRKTVVTGGEQAGTPGVGTYVSKTGRTTGTTTGRVTRTCESRPYDKRSYDNKPVTLLCTHQVAANFYYGDSGSPVLTNLIGGEDAPKIKGVAWGFGGDYGAGTRYYLYSDLNGIRRDMGGDLYTGN